MLRSLQRLALGKAFRGGGSRTWLIVGTAVWLLRKANEVRHPQPETIYRAELRPGQQLVIDHTALDTTGRAITREGRKAQKAEARARAAQKKAERTAARRS
jgi:hypothetical protein